MEVLTHAPANNMLTVDTLSSTDRPDCVDDEFDVLTAHMEEMKSERKRYNTYTTWPPEVQQQPAYLARAGLFYTQTGDRVQCPFCHGVLKQWLPNDNPYAEHAKHFPRCRFIRGFEVGNIPLSPPPVNVITQSPNFNNYVGPTPESMNIVPPYLTSIVTARENSVTCGHTSHNVQVETELDLTREDDRSTTFREWPQHLRQQPEVLSRAGFYHIPSDDKPDRVKCAYCKGKLYNWQPEDDPFVEHARCFPACPYIAICLGEDVIRDLQMSSQSTAPQPSNIHPTPNQVPSVRQVNTPTPNCDTVEARMSSEPVQAVLEMGFRDDLVKQTVETCLRERRGNFPMAEEIASMVMTLEEREQSANTAAATPQSPLRRMAAGGGKGTSGTTGSTVIPSQDQVWRQYRDPSVNKNKIREENTRLKDQYLCKVCMESQVRVTFMPCGHLACCGPCSLTMSECPICRAPISGCVRTYF